MHHHLKYWNNCVYCEGYKEFVKMKFVFLILIFCVCISILACKKEHPQKVDEQSEPFEGNFFIRLKIYPATDVYLHAMNIVPPQDTIGIDLNSNNDPLSNENLWVFSVIEKGKYIIFPFRDTLKVLSYADPYIRLVPRNTETDRKSLFSIDSASGGLFTFISVEYDKYIAL